jgi:hypothetical protein
MLKRIAKTPFPEQIRHICLEYIYTHTHTHTRASARAAVRASRNAQKEFHNFYIPCICVGQKQQNSQCWVGFTTCLPYAANKPFANRQFPLAYPVHWFWKPPVITYHLMSPFRMSLVSFLGPHLCSSAQSSWLQINKSRFDSRDSEK